MSLYSNPTLAAPSYQVFPHERRFSTGDPFTYTERELAASETELGLIGISIDPLLGPALLWNLPKAPEPLLFHRMLTSMKGYAKNPGTQSTIISYLEECEAARWYVIPYILQMRQASEKDENVVELLQFLAKHGAEYSFIFFSSPVQGTDPISIENLRILLQSFGKNAVTSPYLNPFYMCLTSNFLPEKTRSFVNELLKAGCDPNSHDALRFGNTVLHELIASQYYLEPLNIFIDTAIAFKADCLRFTEINSDGHTPLAMAVGLGDVVTVRKILAVENETKQDVGVNQKDKKGRTPILIAAALGHHEICKLLCESNADLTVTDHEQKDLSFYMNAPESCVRSLFKLFSIEPERAYYSKWNYVYLNPPNQIACCEFNDDKCLRPREVILMSATKPHIDRLNHAILTIRNPSWVTTLKRQLALLSPEAGEHYEKTVLQMAMNNHEKTGSYLNSLQHSASGVAPRLSPHKKASGD